MATTKTLVLAAVTGIVLAGGVAAQTAMPPPDSGVVRPNDRAILDRYMTTVRAELAGKLDTRSAHAGQEIAARVSADSQLADGTRLSKGTRLAGRVVQVQAQREGGGGAVLVLTFDRAEPKGGQPIPLRVALQMVSPAANLASTDIADARNSSRNSSIDDGRSTSGDPFPPTTAGTTNSGSRSPATPANSRGQQTAGAADPRTVDPRAAANVGSLEPIPVGNVELPVVRAGDSIAAGPRRTGLPGVLLVPGPEADVSGMLTSAGANITLESGTQLTLRAITR